MQIKRFTTTGTTPTTPTTPTTKPNTATGTTPTTATAGTKPNTATTHTTATTPTTGTLLWNRDKWKKYHYWTNQSDWKCRIMGNSNNQWFIIRNIHP